MATRESLIGQALRILRLAPLAILMAAVVGCSSTASKRAVPYAIELYADPRVNPDANGRPSPIQVTVFELRSSSEFEARDYFTLQGDPQAALGKTLLDSDQVILQPGETRKVTHAGSVEARVVGIVAGYRDLENSQWRLTVPLPEAQNTNIYKFWQFSPNEETVRVSVDGKGLKFVDRESSWWPF